MVKNLLIVNLAVFLFSMILGLDVNRYLAFYGFQSADFMAYQIFTYMFLHGGFMHIFFNMLILYFLGPLLENFWGANRFLKYYMITGIGAGLIYGAVQFVEFKNMESDADKFRSTPTPEAYFTFMRDHNDRFKTDNVANSVGLLFDKDRDSRDAQLRAMSQVQDVVDGKKDIPMLGASGAIYGILIAVGLLFPNTQIMLIIPPIPIKLKYLTFFLGAMAIIGAWQDSPGDNTAHFAHLGGLIVGFIVIKIWNKDRSRFY